MPFPPEFIRWVEHQQAKLRSQLDQLDSGGATLRKCLQRGQWIDITQEEIARLKRSIADLQAVLDRTRQEAGR